MKIFLLTIIWAAHAVVYIIRDFVFKNINYQIGHTVASEGSKFEIYNYTHSLIEPHLRGMSAEALYDLKWYLTLLTTLIFGVLSFLLLSVVLKSIKEALTITSAFYGFILLLSALTYFLAGYDVTREIMGIPQSPIASIILFVGVKVFKKL